MDLIEAYVYKKEVDWSLLHYGLTLPIENQVVFSHNMGAFLKRGESKIIRLFLNDKIYEANVHNVNYNSKYKRKKDTIQIRYSQNSLLAQELRLRFSNSYNYIKAERESRSENDRTIIKLPEDLKEYLAIYTTEDEDTFILETIEVEDTKLIKQAIQKYSEVYIENSFNFNEEDSNSEILMDKRFVKIRKLNNKIGDNLKLLYGYRCQICGNLIGEEYASNVAEAHHIDYFIKSLNNDSDNILIVCPNHHRIIHKVNPQFDKTSLIYKYPNGYHEGLKINKHITKALNRL